MTFFHVCLTLTVQNTAHAKLATKSRLATPFHYSISNKKIPQMQNETCHRNLKRPSNYPGFDHLRFIITPFAAKTTHIES